MDIKSKEFQDYRKILIKTLRFFDSFCKENDIQYVAGYGTALGAIRHKGIIPWDDDIDVLMTGDNYIKFLTLKYKLEGSGYEILQPGDPGLSVNFAKFCDSNTTCWENKNIEIITGVFIDIFPVFPCKKEERAGFKKLFDVFSRKCYYSSIAFGTKAIRNLILEGHIRGLGYLIYYSIAKHLNTYNYIESIRKFNSIYNCYDVYFQPKAVYGLKKEFIEKEWFHNIIQVDFDGVQIPVFSTYEDYLTRLYGDYMTPPPPEKQVVYHDHYFCDLHKRYSLEECKRIKKEKITQND